MIQRLSRGKSLSKLGSMEYKIANSLLTKIFRTITKTGFVIDPYPHNWFVHGYSPALSSSAADDAEEEVDDKESSHEEAR